MRGYKVHSGFTLIEVLIVVAIVGILSAIAYPQYGSFLKKGRRADGQLALLQEAQTMERCKSTQYSYMGCLLNNDESQEKYYAVTLESTASTFTLTITGQNAQEIDPGCNVMTLNHRGERTPDPETTQCWPN